MGLRPPGKGLSQILPTKDGVEIVRPKLSSPSTTSPSNNNNQGVNSVWYKKNDFSSIFWSCILLEQHLFSTFLNHEVGRYTSACKMQFCFISRVVVMLGKSSLNNLRVVSFAEFAYANKYSFVSKAYRAEVSQTKWK